MVSHLMNKSDYDAAAAAAASLVHSGARDVRLVGAYLLGVFLQSGVQAIPAVMDGVTRFLGEGFSLYGPADRKQVLADNSLRSLFSSLLGLLKHHNYNRGAVWAKWIMASDEDLADEVILAIERANSAAKATLGSPKLLDDLTRLELWCDETLREIVGRKSVVPGIPIADIEAAAPAPKVPEPRPRPPSAPAPAAPSQPPAAIPETIALTVSPALRLLLRKLRAFEEVVHRGDLLKAAIVSADLQRALETFDPKLYLPSLLTSYFAALSQHVDEVAPHQEKAGSPSWQALEQYYQVDLDAFVAAEGEPPT